MGKKTILYLKLFSKYIEFKLKLKTKQCNDNISVYCLVYVLLTHKNSLIMKKFRYLPNTLEYY